MKKFLALMLALVICVGLFAGCGDTSNNPSTEPSAGTNSSEPSGTNTSEPGTSSGTDSYTYHTADTRLGTNWNPHTWETGNDGTMLGYMQDSLWFITILDSENGIYQWAFSAAESVTDVTADYQDDLTKYAVTLPEGQTPETTTEGFVHQIKLRDGICWANGEPITADDFIYSMQQALAPEMKNYRSMAYTSGDGALAGAYTYFHGGDTTWTDAQGAIALEDLTITADGATTADGTLVGIGTKSALAHLDGATLDTTIGSTGDAAYDVSAYEQLAKQADANGGVPLTEENLALLIQVITAVDHGETEADAVNYFVTGETSDAIAWDTVGFYKIDDMTLNYVTEVAQGEYEFLYNAGMSLVYKDLYEAGKDTSGGLVTTNYGSSPETFMSWGPYKLESYQDARQAVYVRNENWWGWEKQEDGSLISYTTFEVDGEIQQQFQATRIVIDIMDEASQKQAFLKGEIDEWMPASDELVNYTLSDQLVRTEQAFTMCFFFNSNVNALKAMDEGKGNTNSVVLSNTNFRKAFSLAIDRAEYVTATPGYKPGYSLMNDTYYFDRFNDPTSRYRDSEPAMQAICDLYGIEYGAGTAYATLKDAYNSVTGYNLTEAQLLMKQAHDELVAAGLYTSGEDIVIRIGWAKGSLQSSDNNQIALMNKYINAAAQGSGFGNITMEAIGNVDDRYGDVAKGEFAMSQGAWASSSVYDIFKKFFDPNYSDVDEIACWDPTTETLTLNIDGEDVTMTWQQWANSMTGSGRFATRDKKLNLEIVAQLERRFLEKYYRLPFACVAYCTLISYKLNYYTTEYNINYGYGGFRLYHFNYTDAEWTDLVNAQGGTLNYE